MFGSRHSTPQAQSAPMYTGVRIQTSVFGMPIALIYGQTRVPGNMIWYGDFVTQAVQTGGGGGGGGKGGGGGGSSPPNVTYYYYAGFAFALCEGPIANVLQAWSGKSLVTLAGMGFSLFKGLKPQTPWGYLTSRHPGQDLGYESTCYVAASSFSLGQSANVPNLNFEVAGLFQGIVGNYVASVTVTTPGTGYTSVPSVALNGGGGSGATAHATLNGSVVSPVIANGGYGYSSIYAQVSFYGGGGSGASGHITSIDGAGRITGFVMDTAGSGYTSPPTVVVYGDGSGAVITVSITGSVGSVVIDNPGTGYTSAPTVAFSGGGGANAAATAALGVNLDANPKDVFNDYLTHAWHGVGFPPAFMGDLTNFSNYCLAANLLVSPAFIEQKTAATEMQDMVEAVNCEAVWSSGKLTVVPRGDVALTGNGATYTPPAAPLYDLADNDFLAPKDPSGPLIGTRLRPADAYNKVQYEFFNRANGYNTEIAEATDQNAVDLFGARPASVKITHFFADAGIARQAVQLEMQRQTIRNQYKFTLGWRYILLDPMDIVSITDAQLGLNRQWVRILEITETDTGDLEIVAEDYLAGTGASALYGFQSSQSYLPNYNVDPGSVNQPIFFEPPYQIALQGYEIWIGLSGGSNWGQAEVWVSDDGGSTYAKVGVVANPTRMGTLRAALPTSPTALDQTNILKVDLTVSAGQLTSGTQQDAQNYTTLCWVDGAAGGELLAYATAALNAPNKYDLTYLTRGAYGTPIQQHNNGVPFMRLDAAVFKYPYNIARIGQTLHFKFVSSNAFGGAKQQLGAVADYIYTVKGVATPPTPTGFAVQQNGISVVATWNRIGLYDQSGFELRYGPVGGSWANATNISRGTRGTHVTTVVVPPGTWQFYLAARDQQGVYSTGQATAVLTVTNPQSVIQSAPQAPDWKGYHGNGAAANLLVHYTGVLIADNQTLAVNDGDATFSQFNSLPVATGFYETPVIDLSVVDTERVWFVLTSVLGPGVATTLSPTPEIDMSYSLNGVTFTAYQPWTIGQITARYVKMRIYIDTTKTLPVIAVFTPTMDLQPFTQTMNGVVIAIGGTVVTWPLPLHSTPNVQVTGRTNTVPHWQILPTTVSGKLRMLRPTDLVDVGDTVDLAVTGV